VRRLAAIAEHLPTRRQPAALVAGACSGGDDHVGAPAAADESEGTDGTVTIRPAAAFGADQAGSATLILLHGFGDTGAGLYELGSVLAAALPYLNVVLPTAPLNADETHSWFSSAAADAGGPLSAAVERVDELVATELASGLPSSRILVGGFSQGGLIALAAGLGYAPDSEGDAALGGVVALSTAIPAGLTPPIGVSRCGKRTPVLLCHGEDDPSIPIASFESTLRTLSIFLRDDPSLLTARLYPGLGHRICPEEVEEVVEWLLDRLPPLGPKEEALTMRQQPDGDPAAVADDGSADAHPDSQWLNPEPAGSRRSEAADAEAETDADAEDAAWDQLGADWLEAAAAGGGGADEQSAGRDSHEAAAAAAAAAAAPPGSEKPTQQQSPTPSPPPTPTPPPPPPVAPSTAAAPSADGEGVDTSTGSSSASDLLGSFLAEAQLNSASDDYLSLLLDGGVVYDDLSYIEDEDLVALGMDKRMHRKRFLRYAASHNSTAKT
jgi:predicted esterase